MPTILRYLLLVVALCGPAAAASAQQNRIDIVSQMAPDLAAFGSYDIGVRTVTATDPGRPDIVNTKNGSPTVRYDRMLTLEAWYPAQLAANQKPGGEYRTMAREPSIAVTLYGRAVRDALWHNSLSIAPALGHPLEAMIVDIHIGVPRPELVDKAEVMKVLPYGKGSVTVVEGGLEIPNDAGTSSTMIANACVVVCLDVA